jgi:dGTPase
MQHSSDQPQSLIDQRWLESRESLLLAPYAMHSADSAGRRYPEPPHPYRGPYVRDRDRILHSAAFRRLSYKTQVFMGEMGDYHRTRLTHTLEVASISRTLGRALRLNEDLIEALAMAHDIGHPPFGHAGEDTLNELLADEGGFNHNAQGLRIFEELENRYRTFPGLNLTFEVLEGQRFRASKRRAVGAPLLEVQVVDAADSVAYSTHDADDSLELGLLQVDELLRLPLWDEAARRVRAESTDLSELELRRAVVHELLDWQVGDLIRTSSRRLAECAKLGRQPCGESHQKSAAETVVKASDEVAQASDQLQRFLFERVYRHPKVLAMRAAGQHALRQMHRGFLSRPNLLPEKFQQRAAGEGLSRSVADYLAGMTDRFALQTYQRLFAE